MTLVWPYESSYQWGGGGCGVCAAVPCDPYAPRSRISAAWTCGRDVWACGGVVVTGTPARMWMAGGAS